MSAGWDPPLIDAVVIRSDLEPSELQALDTTPGATAGVFAVQFLGAAPTVSSSKIELMTRLGEPVRGRP